MTRFQEKVLIIAYLSLSIVIIFGCWMGGFMVGYWLEPESAAGIFSGLAGIMVGIWIAEVVGKGFFPEPKRKSRNTETSWKRW